MKKSVHGNGWLRCLALVLLACTDAVAQVTIDKRITIQPIYVSNGTVAGNPGQILYEAETDKIWSQAGIDINFLPGINYTYTNGTFVSGGGQLSSNDPDSNSLLSLYQTSGQAWSVPASGGSVSELIVRLFFVPNIDGPVSGVLGYTLQTNVQEGFFPAGSYFAATNGYAMAISDQAFSLNRLDVIAHELLHALGAVDINHNQFGAGTSASTSPYNAINSNPALNLGSSGAVRAAPTFISDIYPDGADKDQMTGSVVTNNWSSVPVNSLVWNPNLGPTYQIDIARMSPTAANITPYIYNAVPEPAATAAIAGSLMLVLAGLFRRQRTKVGKDLGSSRRD